MNKKPCSISYLFVIHIYLNTLYLVHDILELHHGDPYQPVLPAEAVVLHSDMELVGGQLILVTDYAKQEIILFQVYQNSSESKKWYVKKTLN